MTAKGRNDELRHERKVFVIRRDGLKEDKIVEAKRDGINVPLIGKDDEKKLRNDDEKLEDDDNMMDSSWIRKDHPQERRKPTIWF